MINYYQVLELQDFASAEEIKAAYRRLSKKWHPDVNNGEKYFEEKFKELRHAYEQLSDPWRKQLHDDALEGKEPYVEPMPESHYEGEYEKQERVRSDHPSWGRRYGVWMPFLMIMCIKACHGCYDPNTDRFKDVPVVVVTDHLPYTKYQGTKSYFTMGSSQKEVMAVHGEPDRFTSLPGSGNSEWYYGVNTVTFREGLVSGYTNVDKNLKVRMSVTMMDTSRKFVTLGATREQVMQMQGTPSGIAVYGNPEREVWRYGASFISFSDGKMTQFSNIGRNLKVQP